MKVIRYGVYDADRRLVKDSGDLAIDDDAGAQTIMLEEPVDIPAGGFVVWLQEGHLTPSCW